MRTIERLARWCSLLLVLGVTAAHAEEKFIFLTNWYAQAEHGGFYQAQAEGTYRKRGLDVDVRMGGPQVNVMQLLLAGRADAVMATTCRPSRRSSKGYPSSPSAPCSRRIRRRSSHTPTSRPWRNSRRARC